MVYMLDKEKLKEINTPWSTVGLITTKRTYARRLNEDDANSPTEEWLDIVCRVVQAAQEQLGTPLTEDEAYRLAKHMLELKGTVAGRFLWQLGTKTVDNLGLPSSQQSELTQDG